MNNPYNNLFDSEKQRNVFPREADFFVSPEKIEPSLVTQNDMPIKIDPSLKEVVHKSNLFTDEDKKRFTFSS